MTQPLSAVGPHVVAAIAEYLRQASGSEAVRQAHILGSGAVAHLEDKLRAYYGKRHALCVANGTGGLLTVALALELRESEVVTSPLSWGGTLAGVLHGGAEPLFADVDSTTLTLCPEAASWAVTPDTKALLAVDLFGVPADDAALRCVADKHGLWYIHDAAQSLGALRDGRPAGALADVIVVSFACGKTLFAGEGGALLTDHDEVYERLLWLTQHPYRHKRELGLHLANEFGLNLRIHPLAAVWANADFQPALQRLAERKRQAHAIVEALNDSGLTQRLPYHERKIDPAFFELTAAWCGRPKPVKLREVLGAAGLKADLRPFGLRPLYRHAAYRVHRALRQQIRCAVADEQVKRRFELVG